MALISGSSRSPLSIRRRCEEQYQPFFNFSASAVSSFVVYQNLLDGVNSHIDAGESRLFLVGRYIDTLKLEDDQVRFIKREVRLDNRRLDKGSHWPI